jgi:hypothetical protein
VVPSSAPAPAPAPAPAARVSPSDQPKSVGGRPKLSPDQRLMHTTVCLTHAQISKLRRVIGPQRLRDWIDSYVPG